MSHSLLYISIVPFEGWCVILRRFCGSSTLDSSLQKKGRVTARAVGCQRASMLGLELHEAASAGDYDTLEELLRSGKFDVNLGDEDWGNKTALHWSCQKGYVECSRLLLDYGAKGTARTWAGWTPAHCAAESGRVAILRALHAANIPVDRADNYGSRPSRVAEIYDQQDCMRFLKQAEYELAERRDRFELIDLSEEEDGHSTNDTIEEAEEKERHQPKAKHQNKKKATQ